MTIQIMFTKSEQMFEKFVPQNAYSASEYIEMREMLTVAESLGIVRDWAIY